MAMFRRNLSQLGKVCGRDFKRFNMLEYKAMATPMDSNLKLLADESSELVDATHYKHSLQIDHWVINVLKKY